MRRHLLIAAGLLALLSPAKAADSTVSAMTAASTILGPELLYTVQGGADRKATPAQLAAYTYLLMLGDATANSVGSVTFATVNANVGTFGSTTNCPTFTVNAKGLITAASQAACAPPFSAVTGRTTLAQLPQGIANSIWINPTAGTADMQNIAVPACANDGVHALVYINGTGLQCASLTTGGAGTVTSVTPGGGLVSGVTASCTQTAITVTGTLSEARCINPQTGSTYTVLDTDRGKLVTLTNAAAIAITVPQAGAASQFANGWKGTFLNLGPTTATFTPTTSTINGAASYKLFAGQSVTISSDGTNYQIDPGTSGGVTVSVQSGANYPIVASDFGKLLFLSNASNQIPTLPVASAVGANWFVQVCNDNIGTQTITPTTSTIGGAATYVLPAGSAAAPQCVAIVSDGTNYRVVPDFFRVGANVATAAANALSAAGGLSTTVASGTSALGTGAIGSAACATAVTTSATNTATTDVIWWGFNGDPTAVTGYVPLVAGMLTIIAYPSANNVNFKVCNNTNASITPGAITLNWRVVR
jgi:hypothetical protein